MAAIAPTIDMSQSRNGAIVLVTWPNMQNGDIGNWFKCALYSDKTMQLSGTWGLAGSVSVGGSNDGTTETVIASKQGGLLTFSAPAVVTTQDRVVWLRPKVIAGDGTTSITVVAALYRTDLGGPF